MALGSGKNSVGGLPARGLGTPALMGVDRGGFPIPSMQVTHTVQQTWSPHPSLTFKASGKFSPLGT